MSKGMTGKAPVIPTERIENRIFLLRGQKVMLSTHLAELYDVEPRALVQAVKRNIQRFPEDFMFQLSEAEFENLKSQIVTSSWGGLRRAAPYAFTEQGVAMLSSVLRSERAIHVNIEIMRAFVRLRQMIASNAELAHKLAALEKKYDVQFKVVFDAIRELMTPPEPRKKRSIGFVPWEKKRLRSLSRRSRIGGGKRGLKPRGNSAISPPPRPEGVEIENAEPLDHAPRALQAVELATAASPVADDVS